MVNLRRRIERLEQLQRKADDARRRVFIRWPNEPGYTENGEHFDGEPPATAADLVIIVTYEPKSG